MTLTVGSLFSGVGGFDLGFERAGMKVLWQCENDKAARDVLRRHWPDVTVYEDVHDVGRDAQAVDVLCGGFPCQDVSVAGRRAGLAGERSGLWFEFHRVLAELAPEWVVIENVPGLLSSNRGRDFAVILHGLVKRGYRCAWRVLDSQHFGVPQRRRRVFIVGHSRDGAAAQVLFEREGGGRHPAPGSQTRQGVTASPEGITGTVSSNWAKGSGGPAGNECQNLIAVDSRHMALGEVSPTGGYSLNYTPGVVGTLAASGAGSARPAGQANEADMLVVDSLAFEPRYYSGRKRMGGAPSSITGPLKASDTHRGDSQQHVAGMTAPRRLTPTECARLQGLPDDWNAWLSDSARYRQMGNAITVNVAEWIGRRIVAQAVTS